MVPVPEEDLEETFHFNTSIAAVMEFLNGLTKYDFKKEKDNYLAFRSIIIKNVV